MANRRPLVNIDGRRKQLPTADRLSFTWLSDLPTTLAGYTIVLTSADVTTALGYTPLDEADAPRIGSLNSVQGDRITDYDVQDGLTPAFISALGTATATPSANAHAGVWCPVNATSGMMLVGMSSAIDANRRLWYRQVGANVWSNWIEVGFRWWSAISAASGGSITPNLDGEDATIRTALAVALTVNNPTGTKQNGRQYTLRLRDNGTGRAITWGSEYRSMSATLPTTTTANKTLYCFFRANADENTMDLMQVALQP